MTWPVDSSCLPELDPDDDAYPTAKAALDDATELAVQVLWALSGRQFGQVSDVVRPCPERNPETGFYYWLAGPHDLNWPGMPCGCGGSCIKSGPGAVHLPGPATEILAVTIDGVTLDDSEYILERDVLYRPAGGWWPRQDLSRPAGEDGTWTVEYLRGYPPPTGTGKLVALLATEFYNACTGGKCRLPRTVTEMTRQGVSHRIVNPNEIYASGKTGIPEIDLWLSAVNPHHLLQPPSVS